MAKWKDNDRIYSKKYSKKPLNKLKRANKEKKACLDFIISKTQEDYSDNSDDDELNSDKDCGYSSGKYYNEKSKQNNINISDDKIQNMDIDNDNDNDIEMKDESDIEESNNNNNSTNNIVKKTDKGEIDPDSSDDDENDNNESQNNNNNNNGKKRSLTDSQETDTSNNNNNKNQKIKFKWGGGCCLKPKHSQKSLYDELKNYQHLNILNINLKNYLNKNHQVYYVQPQVVLDIIMDFV